MSPFPAATPRTATISLSKHEEEIVRREPDVNNLFEVMAVLSILAKLRESLRVSDAIAGPARPRTIVTVTPLSLEDLDL
jgi:hypothetical protein